MPSSNPVAQASAPKGQHADPNHHCPYREALEELDRMRPNDFKTGQGHLSPAFREVNVSAVMMHVCRIVNRILHNTDENGQPLQQA